PEGSGKSAGDDPRTSQLAPTPAGGLGGVEKPAGSERNGGHHESGRSKRSSLGVGPAQTGSSSTGRLAAQERPCRFAPWLPHCAWRPGERLNLNAGEICLCLSCSARRDVLPVAVT